MKINKETSWEIETLSIYLLSVCTCCIPSAPSLFPPLQMVNKNNKTAVRIGTNWQKREKAKKSHNDIHRTKANWDGIDAQLKQYRARLKRDLIGFEIELKIDCKLDWRFTVDGVQYLMRFKRNYVEYKMSLFLPLFFFVLFAVRIACTRVSSMFFSLLTFSTSLYPHQLKNCNKTFKLRIIHIQHRILSSMFFFLSGVQNFSYILWCSILDDAHVKPLSGTLSFTETWAAELRFGIHRCIDLQ